MNRHLVEEPLKDIFQKEGKCFQENKSQQEIGKHGKPKQVLTV